MSKKKILIVGRGPWGQRYVETLKELRVSTDTCGRDWQRYLDKDFDGVVVATPPQHHIEIAKSFLSKGIPVMIEKPLALSIDEVEGLAPYQEVPILVNHLHLFSSQYQNIKRASLAEKIISIESKGFNHGPHRTYSSLWDYGPHDLSMAIDLMGGNVSVMNATVDSTPRGELYRFTLKNQSITATSTVGNGALHRARELKVIFSSGREMKYRNEDNVSPPLTNAVICFLRAIQGIDDYRLGLTLSKKILQVLQTIERMVTQENST